MVPLTLGDLESSAYQVILLAAPFCGVWNLPLLRSKGKLQLGRARGIPYALAYSH